jgi:hypothetical protein
VDTSDVWPKIDEKETLLRLGGLRQVKHAACCGGGEQELRFHTTSIRIAAHLANLPVISRQEEILGELASVRDLNPAVGTL